MWTSFIFTVTFSGFCIFALLSEIVKGTSVLLFLPLLGVGLLSIAVAVSVWRLLGRKIVFLDKYISYTGWLGRPKTYRYEDVVDIKIVVTYPDDWTHWEFEDNVTIVFVDGEKLRVPKSAMKASEVRRRIESKTGRKFGSNAKTLKLA